MDYFDNADYSKEFRKRIGFTNQCDTKNFFGAKDVKPTVDYGYIESLNKRLCEIARKTNLLLVKEIRIDDIERFCDSYISGVYDKMNSNDIIVRLNNQGRRCEEVYFSWMRGYVISHLFIKALSIIFEVDKDQISLIGDDDLIDIDTFKRSPKADLEICFKNGEKLRLEIQSGYQGVNDIKEHKVKEAKRIYRTSSTASMVIHFDIYNGKVAFVKLEDIEDGDVNWISRKQMEGQTVFNINEKYFIWKLTEGPPLYKEMDLD